MLSKVLRGWRGLAHALAAVNTYIILSLFFLLVLTPIGILFRLFGKSITDKISALSSWTKTAGDADLEKPF